VPLLWHHSNLSARVALKARATVRIGTSVWRAVTPLIYSALTAHPYMPIAHVPSLQAEFDSICHRAATETLEPDLEYVEEFIQWTKLNFRDIFDVKDIHSVSFAEYLRRSNATPMVKRSLKRAYFELCKESLHEDSQLSSDHVRDWCKRSAFIKVENELLNFAFNIKEKSPRLIQGANAKFIVIVGPWIMALQDHFKKEWGGKDPNAFFTSGASYEKMSAWLQQFSGDVLENDFGKFDSSLCEQIMELETWIFGLFKPPRAVRDLIKGNVNARGRSRFGIVYFIPGTRKSGDPYTSLGNSLLNVLSHIFIYSNQMHLDALTAKSHLHMLAQGDDNLCIVSHHADIDWRRCFARLGMDAEAIKRDDITQAEFCSSLFLKDGDRIHMCPKPGRVMAKLGCFRSLPKTVTQQQALRGSVLGLYNSFSFLPGMKSLFDDILSETSHVKAWQFRKQDWNYVNIRPLPVSCAELVHARYNGPLVHGSLNGWTASQLRYMERDCSYFN
jgi:hypothetical protein